MVQPVDGGNDWAEPLALLPSVFPQPADLSSGYYDPRAISAYHHETPLQASRESERRAAGIAADAFVIAFGNQLVSERVRE